MTEQELLAAAKKALLQKNKEALLEIAELIPAALDIAAQKIPGVVDDVVIAALKNPAKDALKALIEKIEV